MKDSEIRNKLTERFGITTVGGQDKLKGKIMRIGHMGYTDEIDVVATLAALEMALAELGHDVEPGCAVAAAQQALDGPADRGSGGLRQRWARSDSGRSPWHGNGPRLPCLIGMPGGKRRALNVTHRVLVTDKLAEEGLALLRAEKGIEVVVDTKLAKDPQALKKALNDADGIAVRSGTQLTAEVLQNQARLKAIVRAGVGVDNIDVPAATRQGIVVMNTPGGNTVSTAEHTMALMLALARNVAVANDSLKSGKWDRNAFTGTQLEGKTLGVVGLGRVGLAVARRALGFGMTVVGFDPLLSAEKALENGIESVSRLDDLWPRCDFISLHTPLNAETRNLIDARAIGMMKPSVRIINCARGGLIDEAALVEALSSGKLGRRGRRRLRSRAASRRPAADQASQGPGHSASRRIDRGSPGVAFPSRPRG